MRTLAWVVVSAVVWAASMAGPHRTAAAAEAGSNARRPRARPLLLATAWVLVALAIAARSGARAAENTPPYPRSAVIESITWHWDTHKTAAPGSDLWPVTWGPDDHLYTAWGDGGGFGGTNSDGRVSMGFARIEGPPENFKGVNINGGKDTENPASFPTRGKTGGLLCVGGVLYARLNMQNGEWPHVDHALAWSEDLGKTWRTTAWVFPKGGGNFKPSRFLNFGKDYTGVPAHLKGYVYFYGFKQLKGGWGSGTSTYLGRVPQDKVRLRPAYEFWGVSTARARPAGLRTLPTSSLSSRIPAAQRRGRWPTIQRSGGSC
ncbi:MAG: hypothetical protein IMZ44_07425 [Planctomycetes bacterium]|nr:hypothetical protein [Planctomycetota bacterium]